MRLRGYSRPTHVPPLANPGERHRRPGLRLTGQAHLARTLFPPSRQIFLLKSVGTRPTASHSLPAKSRTRWNTSLPFQGSARPFWDGCLR
jgi:hypothetical protein